jgi:hypothetical protein
VSVEDPVISVGSIAASLAGRDLCPAVPAAAGGAR